MNGEVSEKKNEVECDDVRGDFEDYLEGFSGRAENRYQRHRNEKQETLGTIHQEKGELNGGKSEEITDRGPFH